jgi:hypothetical protein
MAEHEYTPPIGSPYKVEAHQAVDWAVEDGGDDLAFAIIYQGDDYGQDGLEGAREAAEHHGIDIVAEVEVAPGEPDVTGPITPGQRGRRDPRAADHPAVGDRPDPGHRRPAEFFPVWLGNTPAWIDAFFNEEVLPSAVYQNFRWVTGLTLWGDDVSGMDDFLAAYEQYGSDLHPPDFYLIASYAQGCSAWRPSPGRWTPAT